MSWKLYGIQYSWVKHITKCWIFFHHDIWTDADKCEPPQLIVSGVRQCQVCGRELWR